MSNSCCFKENCLYKPIAKCDCEESIFFCQKHAFEHLSSPSSKRHQYLELRFKPAEEIKHPIIQKLREMIRDIKIFKKQTAADSIKVIKHFTTTHQNYFNQIREIEKKCVKMIEELLEEKEFSYNVPEDDMKSVLKLDAQQARKKCFDEK